VAVGPHKVHGTLAIVTLPSGHGARAAEDAVHRILDPFAIPHEVAWG